MNSKGKEILEVYPDMQSRIALTYINMYGAEVLEARNNHVKLKYLVDDGSKGYWLNKSVFLDSKLLDLIVK
ncbi:MAG TPA: hypothetical protein VJ990_09855 [Clostridia bacterium]|nr:hypothetical protein [Clostridia bacterium]